METLNNNAYNSYELPLTLCHCVLSMPLQKRFRIVVHPLCLLLFGLTERLLRRQMHISVCFTARVFKLRTHKTISHVKSVYGFHFCVILHYV